MEICDPIWNDKTVASQDISCSVTDQSNMEPWKVLGTFQMRGGGLTRPEEGVPEHVCHQGDGLLGG